MRRLDERKILLLFYSRCILLYLLTKHESDRRKARGGVIQEHPSGARYGETERIRCLEEVTGNIR
jgi:hypothetical protein